MHMCIKNLYVIWFGADTCNATPLELLTATTLNVEFSRWADQHWYL